MVIDASVGVKFVVPEEGTDAALQLLDHDLFVPALFHSEVANALWKKAMANEIVIAAVLPELSKLRMITSALDDSHYIARALEIAVELSHPAYDCLYLAAAEANGMPLVTADSRFIRKLKDTGYMDKVIALSDMDTRP